ncbi:MAG: VirB4 family type IV secretion/conjugal transfer ATPase [Phenylobacterium sp.]|nr:VirB4 family type IV secretion/conjugal transfer ATPase [Phenylobacterium sp.]
MADGAWSIAQSETPVSEYIPFAHHVTDKIVSLKSGEYLSCWRIGGRAHQSASYDDVVSWLLDLNNTVRGIAGNASIAFYSHIIREADSEYPESHFDNVFCATLDAKYRDLFAGGRTMVNSLYLTLVFRPQTDPLMGWFAKGEKIPPAERQRRQDSAIAALEEANRTIGAAMAKYGPELLGVYDFKGRAYSSPMEVYGRILNAQRFRMPVCRGRIADYMAINRPFFATHGELGEIRGVSGARKFAMLEIGEYGQSTEPGELNALMDAPFEFVLTQSFSTLSRPAAKGFLQKHQRHLQDANDVGRRQVEEIDFALDQLVSGEFVMGEHHATVTLYGDSAQEVRDNLAEAQAILLDVGVVPRVVGPALEAAFWAQLPGNWKWRPRPAPITSLNFLSFSPFHNFMRGKATGNPWGPAVTVLKTQSGTPLFFNFHPSKAGEDATDKRLLGNTVMIGQSGAGKTVLLGFLMAQAQKFNPTVVAFDKDRGMEIAIRAMGGRYLPLKTGEPSGFNPFQLEPTKPNLMFLKQFVCALVGSGEAGVTHGDEVEIENALEAMMLHIDKSDRRLSTLIQSLPDPYDPDRSHPTVASRLRKWTADGELGWLFDNATDALDLSTHRLYGFDVTEFLDNPETRSAVMMYLVYRTEGMIDGRRFIYVFDEFWKALADPYFEDLAKNKQKTIRKQNGIFVFATQEPGDALESPIAKTLVQQCATFIFLPNPKADEDDYREGFKVTKAEFELIKSLGESSRRFVIKQGDAAAVAELNLGGFDDELLVLSGTPDNAELVESIIAEVGDDPAVWLPIFFKRARQGGGSQ